MQTDKRIVPGGAPGDLTDPETGLGTEAALERALARPAEGRELRNLICFHLDLDHICYLWGWDQARALLLHGARALQARADRGDVLIRSSRDDLLAVKEFPGRREAEAWTRDVVDAIRAFPFAAGILSARDVSAGICPLGAEGLGPEPARFHARQCALAAGREGLDLRLCGTEACRSCRERWQLLADFPQALARAEFQLWIQFFVDAHTGRVVGGEALSRWAHPRLGLLGPGRYVPALEMDGRISALDFYGLEKTCAFLEGLDRCGIRDFFISCNFSRRTFSDPDFARRCTQTVRRYTFVRKLLVLEVTETQRIGPREGAQMLQNIQTVRRQGVRVMLDDFGAGFSSFHDLRDYPMDGLKLDKELVDNMDTGRGRLILEALVETGHRLGMSVLAEGVEQEGQIEALRKLGCDVLQGFRLSVPLPAGEARRQLLERADRERN